MTNQEILTCSENIKHEYCCTVVRIGECFPIEGADRIQRTLVNGMDMVISKEIKPGDIMIYAANETALLPKFLSANNLYGISNYEWNVNHELVSDLIRSEQKDEAKKLCGFFTKQNRVKLLKLKGTYSFGFLFGIDSLATVWPEVKTLDFNQLIGEDFDTVCGELFVKAYVPLTNMKTGHQQVCVKPGKDMFFRGINDSDFKFHYDSKQLQRSIEQVNPDDMVVVSVKMHGTSAIFAKIPCHIPDKIPFWQKMCNGLISLLHLNDSWKFPTWHLGQGNFYASRTVLKNKYVNLKTLKNTTTTDVWGIFNDLISSYLPDDFYLYAEIVGYKPQSNTFIQKGYDYGCQPGECVMMPYRIICKDGFNSRGFDEWTEWNVDEVNDWTEGLIAEIPELAKVLRPMEVLYHGTLRNLYPDIPVDEDWHKNILAAMKTDQEHFGMELDEPLCMNKVPREGICIRIDNDVCPQNFKLKCNKFLGKESKNIDAGEIDMEMQECEY